jgi:tripartite-type tricarboxylate transporter receptor subunit TctC
VPFIVVVNTNSPLKSVADLKNHPGKLLYGTTGLSSPHNLFVALF